MRVDYNVPLGPNGVLDATRIRETLATLKHLLEAGAKVVLISHLGRPDGKAVPKYSLRPVAGALEGFLGRKVHFASDCIGEAAQKAVAGLGEGELVLLENLRFHSQEEANEEGFARALSAHGDFFIQDAFGALHRAHASTVGVPRFIPGAIGFLVQKELQFLDRVVNNPQRPFLAILGGAKVSDKIQVIHRLLERVDHLIIGGGMAYTFLAAQGISIGKSLLEPERIEDAKDIIETAYNRDVECLLPADHVIVEDLKTGGPVRTTQAMAIPDGWIGVDIGPNSIDFFSESIKQAKTIFWNGPMGIFETEAFAAGSRAVAQALARATRDGATTIVGGGDSLAVLSLANLSDKMSHCSTGGGASLEFLEGRELPGLAALTQK